MKKWLLLSILPLLLLVQQGAGASPIYVSTRDGTYSYTMKFYDFTPDNKFMYSLAFSDQSKVDLHSIPPLEAGGTGGTCTPNCSTVDGSLIQAWITTGTGTALWRFVNLNYDSSGAVIVTGNGFTDVSTRNVTAFFDINNNPISGGTITGQSSCIFDTQGNNLCENLDSYYTCIITAEGIIDIDGECGSIGREPINEVTVPVVNSFMLLGIGLLALGIPLPRGKLA